MNHSFLFCLYLQVSISKEDDLTMTENELTIITDYKFTYNINKILYDLNNVYLSKIKSIDIQSNICDMRLIVYIKKIYFLFFQRLKEYLDDTKENIISFNELYRKACNNEKKIEKCIDISLHDRNIIFLSEKETYLFILDCSKIIIEIIKYDHDYFILVDKVQNFVFDKYYINLNDNIGYFHKFHVYILIYNQSTVVKAFESVTNEKSQIFLNFDYDKIAWLILANFYDKYFLNIIKNKKLLKKIEDKNRMLKILYSRILVVFENSLTETEFFKELRQFNDIRSDIYVDFINKSILKNKDHFLNHIYTILLQENVNFIEIFIRLHSELLEQLFHIVKTKIISHNNQIKTKDRDEVRIYLI